jgi:hypothetical protein
MKRVDKFAYIVGRIVVWPLYVLIALVMVLIIIRAIPDMLLYFAIAAIIWGIVKIVQFFRRQH